MALILILLTFVALISPATVLILKWLDLPRGMIHLRRTFFAILSLGLCSLYFTPMLLFSLPPWAGWFSDLHTWSTVCTILWSACLGATVLLRKTGAEKYRIMSDALVLILFVDLIFRYSPLRIYHGP